MLALLQGQTVLPKLLFDVLGVEVSMLIELTRQGVNSFCHCVQKQGAYTVCTSDFPM